MTFNFSDGEGRESKVKSQDLTPDAICRVHDRFPGVPLAAYNVSGELSMTKAAAQLGWLDEKAAALESLVAIRRAGASIILTYWAKDVAAWLNR